MKNFLDVKTWRDFFTRGRKYFIAFGGLYRASDRVTHDIAQQLEAGIPDCPSGQAFVRLGSTAKPGATRATLITGIGRLGNSIVQVLNALLIAEELPANKVYFHSFNAVDNRSLKLTPAITMERIRLARNPRLRPPEIIWRTYAMTPFGVLANPCEAEFQSARSELRSGLGIDQTGPTNANQEKRLTIYLRSGDIFAGPSEPDYGQPPWAFYEKVLDYKDWSAVELVAEDHGNPNRDLILKWCEREGLEITEYGEQLSDAVQVVLTSSNLVTARGTFIPALVFLSEGPKNIFQFHDERNPLTCRRDVTIFRVTDTRGDYISSVMSRNWVNSAAQRTLMVSYPKESLSPVMKDLS